MAFPLKFPTLLKNTKYKALTRARASHPAEYPLNGFCMGFFFPQGNRGCPRFGPQARKAMGASNRAGSFSAVPTGTPGAHFTLALLHPHPAPPHPLPSLLPPPSSAPSGSPPASSHSPTHKESLPPGTSHQSHPKVKALSFTVPEIS